MKENMSQKLEKKEERLYKLDMKLRKEKEELKEEKKVVTAKIHMLEVKQIEINEQIQYIQQWNDYYSQKETQLYERESKLPELSKQWEGYIEYLQNTAKQWEEYNKGLQKESQTVKKHLLGPLIPPGSDKTNPSIKQTLIRYHKGKLKELGIQIS